MSMTFYTAPPYFALSSDFKDISLLIPHSYFQQNVMFFIPFTRQIKAEKDYHQV